jgi:hypothetical protein
MRARGEAECKLRRGNGRKSEKKSGGMTNMTYKGVALSRCATSPLVKKKKKKNQKKKKNINCAHDAIAIFFGFYTSHNPQKWWEVFSYDFLTKRERADGTSSSPSS